MLPKKPRLPREERHTTSHVEEESHIWAVSYADLLMVLMSFFVVFFSFDDEVNPGNEMNNMAIAIQSAFSGGRQSSQNSNEKMSSPSQQEAGSDRKPSSQGLVGALSQVLTDYEIEPGKTDNTLTVHLPSNQFATRSFDISQELQEHLKKLSSVLQPYGERIEIYVVGHADQSQIRNPNRYIQSNFDLSSLRATRALAYLESQGLPMQSLFAQGSASNIRNSRSLSIRIRLRREL